MVHILCACTIPYRKVIKSKYIMNPFAQRVGTHLHPQPRTLFEISVEIFFKNHVPGATSRKNCIRHYSIVPKLAMMLVDQLPKSMAMHNMHCQKTQGCIKRYIEKYKRFHNR